MRADADDEDGGRAPGRIRRNADNQEGISGWGDCER
jgi:hypothetical protein